MRGFWFGFLAFVLHLSYSYETQVISDEEDICRLFKDGTILRKPGYCNKYIRCEKFKSVLAGECPQGESFSLSKLKCIDSAKSDKYCNTSPCSAKTLGYVRDPKNCRGWYYCDKTVPLGSGICQDGMYFDQDKAMCMYRDQTTCADKFELCDVVPPKIPFKDEQNCNQYFKCSSKGTLTRYTCIEGTYYDVASGTCVKKSLEECNNYPKPESACGSKKLAFRNRFVPDGATCRGYLYCRDLGSGHPDPSPTWEQCGVDYFFNFDRQACMPRADVKCNENRCEGREKGREVSPVPGCQHYLECKNGVEVGVFYCGDGLYFDAKTQECTKYYKSYAACV